MATPEEEAKNLSDFRSTNSRVADIHAHISAGQQVPWMRALAGIVLNLPVKRHLDGKETNLGTEISWLPSNFRTVTDLLKQIAADVAEIKALLQKSAEEVKK